MKSIISVIIPIRIVSGRTDIFERLEYSLKAKVDEIEFLVVDDGSKRLYQESLQQKCIKLGIKYLSTGGSSDSLFNLARARNFGALNANGKYLLFMDVDLLPYPSFYEDLIIEIELNKLAQNIDAFLMIPVVYLNDAGSCKYQSLPDQFKKYFSSNILLNGHYELIEKYSFGTSCILVNRHYYLSIGGQNEAFEGWGYEDYEFTSRLMRLYDHYPKPKSYQSMAGNFMTLKKYEGWKAEYRLYGLYMAMKNIYLVHITHKVDNSYKSNQNKNLNKLKTSLNKDWPLIFNKNILPNSHKSLLLSKNPFCYNHKLNSILGNVEYIDYGHYQNYQDILEYFNKNNFTQIIFPNPYSSQILKELYQYCRKNTIPYLVCERGALPNSSFLDSNGFLYDSESYHPKNWDKKLTLEELNKITDYISELKEGNSTLENQPKRLIQPEKYNIPEDTLVIGLILQTVNDTVIKYFGREFDSLNAVKDFVLDFLKTTAQKVHIIYKNHPLEPNPIFIPDATDLSEVHINDFIELCDCILTINSGAGLIAALLGKPVFTLGQSWYSKEGIACSIFSVNDFHEQLNSFRPEREKLLRFGYYLRFKFYCIGRHHTKIHKKENVIVNATQWIDYEEVPTQDFGRLYFKHYDKKVRTNTILFDFYENSSLKSQAINFSKKRKLQKLKERPIAFFYDAIKNKLKIFSQL